MSIYENKPNTLNFLNHELINAGVNIIKVKCFYYVNTNKCLLKQSGENSIQ